MSRSEDDVNPIRRWLARVRRLRVVCGSQAANKTVAWFVVPRVKALCRKWKELEEGVKEMERKEREKHGWKEGQEPADPWRPW